MTHEKLPLGRQVEKRLRRKIERCLAQAGIAAHERKGLAVELARHGVKLKRLIGDTPLHLIAIEQEDGLLQFGLTHEIDGLNPTVLDCCETMALEAGGYTVKLPGLGQ